MAEATDAHEQTLRAGTLIAHKYRVGGLIGEGGFGSVYRTIDVASNTAAAVKVLSRAALETMGGLGRFHREVDLASRLKHPNTVRVLGSGEDERGLLYIAFELLEGSSLEDVLRKGGGFSMERALWVTAHVLAALEEAHSLDIVHRDLKPGNIFLAKTATGDAVKVLDFGIAKHVSANTFSGLTAAGTSMGTPIYMSREQILGENITARSDLFSLGIVLAEMIIGVSPYGVVPSPIGVVTDRLGRVPVPLPPNLARLPVAAIIRRATAAEPADRYASASEMRVAIGEIDLLPAPSATGPAVLVTEAAGGPSLPEARALPGKSSLANSLDPQGSARIERALAPTSSARVASDESDRVPQTERMPGQGSAKVAVAADTQTAGINQFGATMLGESGLGSLDVRGIAPRSEGPASNLPSEKPPAIAANSGSDAPAPLMAGGPSLPQETALPAKRAKGKRLYLWLGLLFLAIAIAGGCGYYFFFFLDQKPTRPRRTPANSSQGPTSVDPRSPSPSASSGPAHEEDPPRREPTRVRCPNADDVTQPLLRAALESAGQVVSGEDYNCPYNFLEIRGIKTCSGPDGHGWKTQDGSARTYWVTDPTRDREFLGHISTSSERTIARSLKTFIVLDLPKEKAALVVKALCREPR